MKTAKLKKYKNAIGPKNTVIFSSSFRDRNKVLQGTNFYKRIIWGKGKTETVIKNFKDSRLNGIRISIDIKRKR